MSPLPPCYIPINPANADRSEGVGEGGWRGGGRRRGEDEMGRGRRRGEMREARRRDHAGRGAEARHGRTDGSFTPGDRTNNSFIFRCRFANSALRDPLGGR